MLPFRTGMRVTGKDFCGRKKELSLLREYIQSSARVYILGERRIGKTSLIFEAIRPLRSLRMVYIDLMAVKTLGDVCERIAGAIVRTEKRKTKLGGILGSLALLRPSFTIDPMTNMGHIICKVCVTHLYIISDFRVSNIQT
jgi:hypothetical protein